MSARGRGRLLKGWNILVKKDWTMGRGTWKGQERGQVWLEAPRYWNIALVVSCSTETNVNLCFWKSFTTTSPAAGLLHSQRDQQALETEMNLKQVLGLSQGTPCCERVVA